jgi:quinol monooxygenase YgiN
MPEIKWTPVGKNKPDPGREYLALISYLPLTTHFIIPKFLYLTGQIQKQLAESEGVLGYSLIAYILKKEFWTMSAWEDDDSLSKFVRTGAHLRTMRELSRYLNAERRFIKVSVKGAEIPMPWDRAKGFVR